LDFCRLVGEMDKVAGAGMTPAGEAGEAEMASGVWSGTVDLASTPTLSIFSGCLEFRNFTARRCSCRSCGFGLDLEIAKSELTMRKARMRHRRPLRMWRRHERHGRFPRTRRSDIPKLRKSERDRINAMNCYILLQVYPKYRLTSTPLPTSTEKLLESPPLEGSHA
jgi:hypothetical protein